MHIDGIKVIEKVENYSIKLIEDGSSNNNRDAHYSYDDVKKMQ